MSDLTTETATLPAPTTAIDPGSSVTESVTTPGEHHTQPIGDPKPFTPKESKALAAIRTGHYDDDGVIDMAVGVAIDQLGLDMNLHLMPVKDWQPGDQARLDTPSGRYLVELVRIHRSPETAVDAASVRVLAVIDASPISGLDRGAEGDWPLTSLGLVDGV
ncbi:MAG: hypothetical protein AAGJ38_05035 [Planctomycetota bacterium]